MLFEKAARLKLRFNYRGLCSVEDLWDLGIEPLDETFKQHMKLKKEEGESLLEKKTKDDEILELKIAIIRHIVKVKIEEQKAQENAIYKAERKEKLLHILAQKQDAKFNEMTEEEINKLINEL